MGDSFISSKTVEGLDDGTHNKRHNDFKAENLIQKKPKVYDLDTEIKEQAGEDLSSHVDGKCQQSVVGPNGQHGENVLPQTSEAEKGDQIRNTNSCQDMPGSSGGLTVIEADAAEDKGSRHSMEDAWVVLLDPSLEHPGKLRCAHFAIYDGHGGRLAAEYARTHLHSNVLSAGLPRELMDVKAAKKAILEGFRRTDELIIRESAAGGWQDGATAVCIWILGQSVLVANIGDAKAVLARSALVNGDRTNNSLKAIVITREHKAIYPQERARIQKAGGSVGSNGRLQGRLEVSRAFGDRQFKKVGVIATPDVHSFELTEREHFIILGCDGLWGVFGASDAVEFVDELLKEGLSASVVSRRLVREAVRERRCKDNCTAIVIVFRH
ncbi:probable protein phosphatase 2C 8 [Aristolochia californica]|uniref:probable protein phosphatase 2C 8 n=1 Tax=Aristolochia californica TaxID=171875 RepID=UPI0035D62344